MAMRERTSDIVVRPSMPILYFSDIDAYFASRLRIATVGLNPSREEFPSADPWRRFPEGESLDPTNLDGSACLRALNPYFNAGCDPYMSGSAVHVIDRTKPYVFRARRLLAPAPCLLVRGRAAQLAFGSVSAVDKDTAGAAINELVR